MKYLQIKENDDWEGEEWTHFLLIDGNEKAIEVLKELIFKFGEGAFEVVEQNVSSQEVETLCKQKAGGYMRYYGKNDNVLPLKKFKGVKTVEEFDDLLYKGQLRSICA